MVKTKGPIMSLTARGTVADEVTYSSWKGRTYAKKKSSPTNNQQASQLGIRAGMRFLSIEWAALTPTQQQSWNALAAATAISPFNAFTATNLQRISAGEGVTKEYPAAEALSPVALTHVATSVLHSNVTLAFVTSNGARGWACSLYQSKVSGFTPGPDNLVRMFRANALPDVTATTFKPISRGTWYFRSAISTDDGKMGMGPIEKNYTF